MDTVNDVICLILLFGIVKLIKIKKNVTIDVSDQSKFNQILKFTVLGKKKISRPIISRHFIDEYAIALFLLNLIFLIKRLNKKSKQIAIKIKNCIGCNIIFMELMEFLKV